MRRWFVTGLGALAIAGALSAAAACSDDGNGGGPIARDGSGDTALVGDTSPVTPDAPIPEGDVCGDRGGLEQGAPWPMRGGCPRRAGFYGGGGPQTAVVKWSVPLPSADTSPAVSGTGVVWFGTSAGEISVVSLGGIGRGSFKTNGQVLSSPAIAANGAAVFGSTDGNLYGARITPGPAPSDAGPDADDAGDTDAGPPPATVTFTLPLGPIASSPAIAGDGTIYVTTRDGKLFAVAPDGASSKWNVTTGDTLGSSPAIGAGGTVYVGSSDGKLYAVKPDGSLAWATPLGSPVTGSPAVGGDDSIYVGTTDGKLHALDTTGKVKWSYATGGPITTTPAVYQGAVYVGSEDKKLHAVSTGGLPGWTYETLGAVGSPIIAQGGVIYVGSADARLYAINATGSLFYAVNVKGRVKGAPAIGTDTTVYVTTENAIVAVGP